MKYEMKTPCPLCPFRTDVEPFLLVARVEEILNSLVQAEFPCHKTTATDDEGETFVPKDAQHCAGALILLEKMEQPSQMMRICERLGMYDRTQLDMAAPVYDDAEEMLEAQSD